jgi:uncharacterized membrane protein YbhN (UPF0104 family)
VSTAKRGRGLIINVGLSIAAFGLLAWTVWGNREQIRDVWAARPDPVLFLMGLVLYLVALVLTFVRWYILVRALSLPFRLRDALRLGFIGNVFNLVIPGAVGGDLIKAAFLCREQAKKTQAVASMVIDRGVGLLGLFLLAGIAGLFELRGARLEVRSLVFLAWGMVAAGVFGLAVLFTPGLYRPLMRLMKGHGRMETVLGEMIELAGAYRERLGVVAGAVAMAFVGHAIYVMAFTAVDQALYGESAPTLGRHLVIVPLVLFTTAVPLPFGALGLTEKASETLFDLVRFPGGAVAMMGYRVVMYLAGLVCVVVYLANARQVRSLRREAAARRPELAASDVVG